MSQQHKPYSVSVSPEEYHTSVQLLKGVQTGIIVHDVDSRRNGKVDRDPKINQSTILLWLGDLWHWFVDYLSSSPELQVWQKRDRQGNLWWHVYNPATRYSARLNSEAEVRVWIEQSYQRR